MTAPRAVAFVTVFDLKGHSGSNLATRALIDALAARDGIDLVLLAPEPADGTDLRAIWPGIDWIPLPQRSGRAIFWHLATARRVRVRLRELFQDKAPDIVAVRLGYFFVPSAFLFPRPGCQLVLLVRGSLRVPLSGLGALGTLAQHVMRRMTFAVARRADRLLFAFAAAVDEWRRLVPEERIAVIPNGADMSAFPLISKEQARAELRDSGGPELSGQVVGFAGSLRERHCLEQLVRACALLSGRSRAPELLMVGDGPVRPSLEALATELGIHDRVHFVGRVPHPEVAVRLAACDLLYGLVDATSPSNPIKVYEGLATGRPVVTSRQPELLFVERERLGVIVDSTSVEAVARGLEEGLALDWTAADTARARSYIASNHSWDTLARAILESPAAGQHES